MPSVEVAQAMVRASPSCQSVTAMYCSPVLMISVLAEVRVVLVEEDQAEGVRKLDKEDNERVRVTTLLPDGCLAMSYQT